MPASGDPVAIVGYGVTSFIGVDPYATTWGWRRYAHTLIDRVDTSHLYTDNDRPGTSGGDSGGPALFEMGTPVPHRYAPVIAVASSGPEGGIGHNYAAVLDANLAWVMGRLDTDSNGLYDASCGPGYDPSSTPITDLDGDGILNARDNCPIYWNPCQEDDDGDRIGNACDTCPSIPNPGEAQDLNSDGDRLPDACDNCPFVPNDDQEDVDELDGDFARADGVGDACDNCPGVLNPRGRSGEQPNCNIDAESVMIDPSDGLPYYLPEGAFVGTYCTPPGGDCGDRTPCADACPAGSTCRWEEASWGRCTRYKYGVGDACDPIPCGETVIAPPTEESDDLNEIRINPLRMGEWEHDYLPVGTIEARTGLRFCRCNIAMSDRLATRQACSESLPPGGTGGCAISDLDAYDNNPEEHPVWRGITVEFQDALRPPELPPVLIGSGRGAELVLGYADPAGSTDDGIAHWNVGEDIGHWTAMFMETIPYGQTAPMRGSLWTHTPGERGSSFHTRVRELSNHYFSGGVRPRLEVRAPLAPCFHPIGPFFDTQHCLTCASELPAPWLVSPVGACGPGPSFPDEGPVMQFRDTWLGWGELWTDPYPSHFSPDHPDWEDTRWIAVSDARSALESQTMRYVRVALDGTVRTVLRVTEDGFLDGCDGPCPNDGDAPSVETFVATASARRQAVWLASADEGNPRIWRYDLLSGQWSELSDVPVEDRIEAITYDATLDRVLVLGGPPGNRALVEVGLAGGGVGLAELEGAGEATSFALATAENGAVYIVSVMGGIASGNYCAVRFVPEYAASGSPVLFTGGTGWGEAYVPPEGIAASASGLSLVELTAAGASLREHATFAPEESWCLFTF